MSSPAWTSGGTALEMTIPVILAIAVPILVHSASAKHRHEIATRTRRALRRMEPSEKLDHDERDRTGRAQR